MILKANKISKNYGKKSILHDIDADINVNEISGLLGPNGAGKTTLFYILAGLLRPSEGEIIFDKSIITRKTISERANLGIVYLPQEPSIFRNLSVLENIKSAFEIQKINKVDIDLKTEEVLNDFDIESIAMQKGNQLSGGQRRRVEIARSISLNPAKISDFFTFFSKFPQPLPHWQILNFRSNQARLGSNDPSFDDCSGKTAHVQNELGDFSKNRKNYP